MILQFQEYADGESPLKGLCRKMRMAKRLAAIAVVALVFPAFAADLPTLATVVVTGESEGLIGTAGSASEGTVTAAQLENRPLLRPAEVLESVPGLIISQHSGDGKANQYYLRGFNLDHGTDFATTVLGMPVNLPSNAHGQGYSDLQFLIPELVERMQYRKGPYAADAGDFATAGSAAIDYFRRLNASFAQASVGEKGYRRALLAGSPAAGNMLYALEWTASDGPWVSPEKFGKQNGLLRYSQGTKDNGWSAAAIAYQAEWNSTDQVPQRAIDSGLSSRFGNLDPTDGGRTRRNSVSGEWSAKGNDGWSRANAYVIDYSLDLWSDFTYCTLGCAPGPGDQFQQSDRRQVYGANAARTWYADWDGKDAEFTLGLQSRMDDIGKVGLYATTARQIWGTVREDRVQEGSIALYGESQIQWQEKFRSILGLRGDFYGFDVRSSLAQNSGRVRDHIVSPKLALIFGPWEKTEYYADLGYGFHSNDARGATTTVNADFRDTSYLAALTPVTPLVRARGYEAGLRSALWPSVQTTLALWRLDLASELVFSGDAGTTAPSFPSRRQGVEWSTVWKPGAGIIVDADLALSRARYSSIDPALVPGNYIPGSIEQAASIGATGDGRGPWTFGMRLRYFGPRPLVEDNSVRSKASTLVNFQAGYKIDSKTKLSLDILNLFDAQVSDIDYYYASQLQGEAAPVNDIHSHPAEPRTLRLTLRLGF